MLKMLDFNIGTGFSMIGSRELFKNFNLKTRNTQTYVCYGLNALKKIQKYILMMFVRKPF